MTEKTDGLEIAEFWNSCDQMQWQDFIWMNVILKRHLREQGVACSGGKIHRSSA